MVYLLWCSGPTGVLSIWTTREKAEEALEYWAVRCIDRDRMWVTAYRLDSGADPEDLS